MLVQYIDYYDYIVENLLYEINNWDKENILIEPTKYDISIKINEIKSLLRSNYEK